MPVAGWRTIRRPLPRVWPERGYRALVNLSRVEQENPRNRYMHSLIKRFLSSPSANDLFRLVRLGVMVGGAIATGLLLGWMMRRIQEDINNDNGLLLGGQ